MMKITIVLLVGVIARQVYGDAPEAIIGGTTASPGQFPHQVSLQVWRQHTCGGSIIDSTHIITAAHCVDNPEYNEYMTVVSGTTSSLQNGGGTVSKIKCIRIHPGYTGQKEDSWKDDIAVITLEEPLTFSNVQKPIRLPTRDYATGTYRGMVSGWGLTSLDSKASPTLQFIGVNVLTQASCLKAHNNPPTIKNHICTLESYGKGACSGDSGGPLTINNAGQYELCGIASWVARCALGVPDVFTNVYKYLDFIKECISMC